MGQELGDLIDSTSARLQALLEAAEHASTEIGGRGDAEEQAVRHVDGVRRRAASLMLGQARLMSEMAERLRAELESTERQMRSLVDTLEGAAGELTRASESVEGEAVRGRRREPHDAAATLLATKMALAGSSREEVESRLQMELEIEDAEGILDAAFGRGRGFGEPRAWRVDSASNLGTGRENLSDA